MTRVVTIRVRATRAKFIERLRELVENMGKSHTVEARTLRGHIAKEFFRENLKEYEALSAGGSLPGRPAWKPLAPSTIRRKLRKKRKGMSKRRRRQYDAFVTGFRSRGFGARSEFMALEAVGEAPRVPINIDTKKLIRSLSPGTGEGPAYRAKPFQIAEIRGGVISLGTRVKYARHVQKVRPVLPDAQRAKPWIITGAQKAMVRIADVLARSL